MTNDPAWTIRQIGYDPATNKAYEGLFTLGSGALHLRGSWEEPLAAEPQDAAYERRPANVSAETMRHPISKWGTFVPGVYDAHPLLGRELVNLPWCAGAIVEVDGERLDMGTVEVRSSERTLDLRTAVLSRRTTWRTRGGATVEIEAERFVSAVRRRLVVQSLGIAVDRSASVVVRMPIDAGVRTNGYDHFASVEPGRGSGASSRLAVRLHSGRTIEVVTRAWSGPGPEWTDGIGPRATWRAATATLGPGQRLDVERRTVVTTALDGQLRTDPASSLAALDPAIAAAALRAEHERCWADRWMRHDVAIDGPVEDQRAIRAAIFHLLRAHPGVEAPLSIDAKGYAGEAYWGRFFWDSEIELLPFYLYTDPALAASLLRFRIATLDAARANARRYGLRGARYPWEADETGRECCAAWIYADHEIHVSPDVVLGLAHHAAATGSDALLKAGGAMAVGEVARFLSDRCERLPGGTCALLGVMGPDEYTPIVHNDAYTNAVAAEAMREAARLGADAGIDEREAEELRRAAEALPIPRCMTDASLILQCEGFDRLPDPDFARTWPDIARPYAQGVPQEWLFRTRAIKQAAVIKLMELMPARFNRTEFERAWAYYVPTTTHDSSLSPAPHAIVAARMGRHEDAYAYFRRLAAIDFDPAHGGAAEGIHIAAAAGVWRVAVMGFAGLLPATEGDRLTFEPRLPSAWRSISFRVCWRGSILAITLRPGGFEAAHLDGPGLPIAVGGMQTTVQRGAKVVGSTDAC
ncbi:MAG: glycoside hydrolase family 65 protein [Phycisphaerales bacterium]|nr:glycoside hydrolase family 65 protein [Phycisphaerales bacterium]